MTWENERRAICRAMLDAADTETTHAVYVCRTAYNGFADADALLGLGSGRYMELPPDKRELAREKTTELGRDLKAAAVRHGEPEPTEARLTRVHGVGLELDVRTGRPEWAADPDGMPADLFLEWRAGLKTTRAARWARRHAVADTDPLWESFKETADVPKWFGRDLYGELDADTLALAAAYGWNDQRVRARLHDAVQAAVEKD